MRISSWPLLASLLAVPASCFAGDALTPRFRPEEARIPYVGRDSRHFLGPIRLPDLQPDAEVCDSFRKASAAKLEEIQARIKAPGAEPRARVDALRSLAAIYSGDERTLPVADSQLTEAYELALREAPERAQEMLALRGILRLRMGELKNCVERHNSESCIFPLSKRAVHVNAEGAEKALADFRRYLEKEPGDLHVRWLLNVAAMAAGKFPAGVPKEYRFPLPGAKGGIGRFRDVGGAAGLQRTSMGGGGALLEDLDGDGRLDAVLSTRLPCQSPTMHQNSGDGTFREIPDAVVAAQKWVTNAVQADFNNDGRTDLFLIRGGWFGNAYPGAKARTSLLVNQGDWKFTEESDSLGLNKGKTFGVSAQWVDVDLDGWVDLFVCNETRGPDLFRNVGGKKFVESAAELGISNAGVCKGSSWADIDGDGFPDLVIGNYASENRVFLNEGGKHFREVKIPAVNHNPTLAFSQFFFDYDNDGKPDLFIGAYNRDVEPFLSGLLHRPPAGAFDTHRLFRNVSVPGEPRFEDVTKAVGLDVPALSMGSNFGDLDNDGFLDLFLGTGSVSFGDLVPNQAYLNRGGRRFEEITYAAGFGNLQKGHGVAIGDVNGDGQEDVLVNLGGTFAGDKFFPSLYANPGGGNDWVTLRLEGTKSNRSAIGAKVEVRVRNGKKRHSVFRTVGASSSFGGNPLELHFGLGKQAEIESVVVSWPNRERTVSVYEHVAKNAVFALREGDPAPRKLPRGKFAFPSEPAQPHPHH